MNSPCQIWEVPFFEHIFEDYDDDDDELCKLKMEEGSLDEQEAIKVKWMNVLMEDYDHNKSF